jgi:imidazolonepropionase-like amidohydrolase
LIDCHAHYLFDPGSPSPFAQARDESDAMTVLRGARNARSALQAGVTTTREAGAPRQLNFPLRDAIASGLIPGPRILAPGEAITITGGHGLLFGREADGIDELKKLVRQQMRDGADVVKIIASEAAMLTTPAAAVEELTAEEISVLVAEARRRGLRIFSHAQNSTSVIRSARAGVDSVEHGFLADTEATAVLAETGTALVPTLAVTAATLEQPDLEPVFRERMRRLQESQCASCERAIREGVNVLAGTDCGMAGVFPDMLWREVVLLHERGLSKPDALKAATSKAAELLGVEDEVGRIEVGKQADLVLVAGDPLDDLACLASAELVMKAGEIVH